MRAIWNEQLIAESDDTVVLEGNHYFPLDAVDSSLLEASDHSSYCPWKGTASYFHIKANGAQNRNGAWYYAEPFDAASEIRGRVAFWNGVSVEP